MFATRSIVIAAAAVAGIGAAHAEPKPPVPAAATTAAPAARPAEPLYCFKEPLTDSRIIRKICRTKSEWVALGEKLPLK